jgi:hypothetical protein
VIKRIILFLLIATGGWWLYNGGAVSLGNRIEAFGTGLQPAVGMDADPEDVLCLQGARDAYDEISSEIRRLPPPPLDEQTWGNVALDLDYKIRQAESDCGCATHACAKARQALSELHSVVRTLDDMIGGRGVANPATPLERADNLLNDSRRLASER